jgi:hypothetical protein
MSKSGVSIQKSEVGLRSQELENQCFYVYQVFFPEHLLIDDTKNL